MLYIFFDVSIDNINTKYYYLVTPNGNTLYNENEYTLIGNNLYNYKKILGDFEVRYLYYNTRESENEITLDNALNNKNIILYFNDSIKNIVNKDFLIDYTNLENTINSQNFQFYTFMLLFSIILGICIQIYIAAKKYFSLKELITYLLFELIGIWFGAKIITYLLTLFFIVIFFIRII